MHVSVKVQSGGVSDCAMSLNKTCSLTLAHMYTHIHTHTHTNTSHFAGYWD